jgi:hypothetical protein
MNKILISKQETFDKTSFYFKIQLIDSEGVKENLSTLYTARMLHKINSMIKDKNVLNEYIRRPSYKNIGSFIKYSGPVRIVYGESIRDEEDD